MQPCALNHVNILSRDMEATAAFYERLGFKRGPRPTAFPDPGIWLYVEGYKAVLHINPSHRPPVTPLTAGVKAETLNALAHERRTVDHFGFSVKGSVADVTAGLDRLGIKYDLWDAIPGACRALYFEDPTTGARIEYVLVDNFVQAQAA